MRTSKPIAGYKKQKNKIRSEEEMSKLRPNILGVLILTIALMHISCNIFSPSKILVNPSSDSIKKFETLFIDIDLTHSFENPYDPEEIRVDAIISTPDGDTLTLPCFYKYGQSGKSDWEARFTAMQAGTHSYHIRVESRHGRSNSREFYVSVKESDGDGFLRVDKNSLYDFVFDSGKRFRGVGLNLGWELESDWKYPYETYIDELAKNNANFFRTWMCTWNLPLEWTRVVMDYDGLLVDEFMDWDKMFSHSTGLRIDLGKSQFTEDDTSRLKIDPSSGGTVVYNIKDIRRFKIKLFYNKNLSKSRIKCYSSPDNITYSPINVEFSQTSDTYGEWRRMFIAYIYELPAGTNYLKIEFIKNMEGLPELGNIQIEYGEPKDILDAPGLGRYYDKTAERLDEVLNYSEEKGLYVMLTIDYHGVFKDFIDSWGSNAEWRTNPYNAANGGPCETPADFFTNSEAKRIYKNKLRYLVARWGYSTHLACWELFNEIDNVMDWQKVPAVTIVSWHKEMAAYLKQVDPYKHLVSTSVSHREVPDLWKIDNLDFSGHHVYGPGMNVKDINKSILKYVETFDKPDVVSEFALGWKGPGRDYPPELYEINLHKGLWWGMFSPTPVLPLSWWWEWHYHYNHYFHLKVAADFVSLMLKNNDDIIEKIAVNSVDAGIETMGLKSGDDLFIWLQNSGEEVKNDLVLDVEEMENISYLMKYYGTWTGKYSGVMEIEPINGQLILKDVHLGIEKDMAVWLTPM
jgi:hypothetical protein